MGRRSKALVAVTTLLFSFTASTQHSTAVKKAAEDAGIIPRDTSISNEELARFEEVATLAFNPGSPLDGLQRLVNLAYSTPLKEGEKAEFEIQKICDFYEKLRQDPAFKNDPEWQYFERSHAQFLQHLLYGKPGKTPEKCGEGALQRIDMEGLSNEDNMRRIQFSLKKKLDFEYKYVDQEGEKQEFRYSSDERILQMRVGESLASEGRNNQSRILTDASSILAAYAQNMGSEATTYTKDKTLKNFPSINNSIKELFTSPIEQAQNHFKGRAGRKLDHTDPKTRQYLQRAIQQKLLTSRLHLLTMMPEKGTVKIDGGNEVTFKGSVLAFDHTSPEGDVGSISELEVKLPWPLGKKPVIKASAGRVFTAQ